MSTKWKVIPRDKISVLLHVGMWVLYFIFWCYMFYTRLGSVEKGVLLGLFVISVQIMVVYINVYVLIPRFLSHGKGFTYSVLLVALWGVCGGMVYVQITHFPFTSQPLVEAKEQFLFPVFITILASSLPTFILVLFDKLKGENRMKQLEKETVEHELKFLKAQINPHFLFNSINSIFQLIDKDREKSKEMLAKFSEMLRYHLYETGSERVPLSREIEYLENYAHMEKLRKGRNLELSLNIQSDIGYVEILPLVLLTFVENAFKHVSNWYDRTNRVELNLTKYKNTLHIQVINTRDEESSAGNDHYSGIGLSNVKKRLELLYPDLHYLDIQEEADCFQVDLFIQLKEEYELHHS